MATKDQVEKIITSVDKALALYNTNLQTRSEWGTVTFTAGALDFERAQNLLGYLKVLPLDYLPDTAASSIHQSVNSLFPILDQIDKFKIEINDPGGTRTQYLGSLKAQVDQLYTTASQWIPFLAYQKGDVDQNIKNLTKAVQSANQIVEKAQLDINIKGEEIQKIIQQAREASASAGAAVFTKDFDTESTTFHSTADTWLKVSIGCLVVTFATAILFWVYAHNFTSTLSVPQIIQESIAKLIILSMLITATTWSAKNYRSLKHLGFVNRHRALSLRTLQAFTAAASDEQSKDAVLMEATKAVFNAGATGYLDGAASNVSSEQTIKVVELAKSITKVAE